MKKKLEERTFEMAVIDLGKNNPNRQMQRQRQPAAGQPMQMNIDLRNCQDIMCPSCGSEIFIDASKLKYISPLQSPTGKPTVAAVVVGKVCASCNELFNPDVWKRLKELKEEKP